MKTNQLFFRGIIVFLLLGCYSTFAQNRGGTIPGDLPCDAIEIACGLDGAPSLYPGSTNEATFDGVDDCGGGANNTAPGLWYKWLSDGSTIVASTCDQADFDTKISIFSGSCNALVCETGDDDFSGCSGNTSQTDPLNTVAGETYFILVHGWLTQTGNFTLYFTCIDPPDPILNDECPNAISLSCGQTVTGSTDGATDTGEPGFCDTSVTAPGVWYTIEGTGGLIALSTCGSDYDTKLSVYEGACNNLNCVIGNDDDFNTFNNGLDTCVEPPGTSAFTSSLEFQSTAGSLYYIYVHGFSDNTGDFTLTVDCACYVTIDSDCQTVYINAEGFANESANLSADGFGTGALTYEWSDGQMGADITVSPTETTVYTVTLTDDAGCESTAETTVVVVDADCDNNPNNDKIQICHRGETICVSPNAVQAHLDNHGDTIGACDQLNCDTRPGCSSVTDPADGSTVTDPDADISWSAAPGYVEGYSLSVGTTSGGSDVVNNLDVGNVLTYDLGPLDNAVTYYVTVTPYNSNGSAIGCPESSFTTDLTPANDLCGDAIAIECGDVVTGDTSYATDTDEISPFCGITFQPDNNSAGVWFSFLGTGDDVTLDLGNSSYDTRVVVYDGNCGALNCIDGDDDDGPGLTSLLTFSSVAGTTYSIYVAGWSTSTGIFEMSVECSAPPIIDQGSDDCANAPEISCGDTFSGTTVGYSDSGVYSCDTGNFGAPGVWYKFDGNGDTVTASTCNAGSDYDTKLHVFTDCFADVFSCVTGNDDISCAFSFLRSEVTFATNPGTSYYIYVSGFASTSSGNYELSISCTPGSVANPDGLTDLVPWSLSPNPSIGTVDLNLERFLNTDVTIDILDLTGKVLATHRLEDIQNPKYRMELNSSLNNGMYLVRLSSDQHISSKRLILNR